MIEFTDGAASNVSVALFTARAGRLLGPAGWVVSAMGHKRTFCDAGAMSALPPKADIRSAKTDARFVPEADIRPLFKSVAPNAG